MATLPLFRSVHKCTKTFSLSSNLGFQNVHFKSTAASNTVVERAKLENRIKSNGLECHKQMENGLFFLYHRGKPMLATKEVQKFVKEPVLASFDAAVDIKPGLKSDSIFLRVLPELGKPLFATQLTDDINVAEVEYRFGGKFVDMRVAIFNVDENPWSKFLCKGHALLRWHQRLRFCSSCGHEMGRNFAGNQRECLSCKTMQYPTTFPVAIVLLTTPDHSKALLIRQPRYPAGMFSCVAGFVDAGETLFECVQREVAEEVSVEILADQEIQLMGSQFWPFPSGSLMMGCMAYVDPKAEPKPCMEEVELARWFSPEEIFDALELVRKNPYMRIKNDDPDKIFVPPKGAIANFLLKTWLEKFVKY